MARPRRREPRPERSWSPVRARLHLHRALDEEIDELSRPLDRARSRTVLLAALGAVVAALVGAGVGRATGATVLGLLVAVALAALVVAGLSVRLRTLDHRADRAWQLSWARLEADWSGRAAHRPDGHDSHPAGPDRP
ncbi:hypothetical protein ACGFX4_40875 [Kitasatospora sp. NPDC048365]|uniref:hypothetical protein n=1 Tax=Kitasatospora sp. NPDC048365 TaxID=3364050 RepID=UPI00371C424B